MGTVFASNLKAYRRWKTRVDKAKPKRSLSPQQLERAVSQIGLLFPDNVIRGTL